MDSQTLETIDQRWAEYDALIQAGEYYAAMLRVAEVCSAAGMLRGAVAGHQKRCLNVALAPEVLEHVRRNVLQQEERLNKIMALGDRWNDDEVMLALTIRIQNDLLVDYLGSRGVDSGQPAHILDWETLLEQLSTRSRRELNRTLAAIRKSWGLPLRHRAFGSG